MSAQLKSILLGTGIFGLCCLLVFMVPCPNNAQMTFLRIGLSFLIGAGSTLISGLLVLSIGNKLRLGAGILFFIVTYVFSPKVLAEKDCHEVYKQVRGKITLEQAPLAYAEIVHISSGSKALSSPDGITEFWLPLSGKKDSIQFVVNSPEVQQTPFWVPVNTRMPHIEFAIDLGRPPLQQERFDNAFLYSLYMAQHAHQSGANWQLFWHKALTYAHHEWLYWRYEDLQADSLPVQAPYMALVNKVAQNKGAASLETVRLAAFTCIMVGAYAKAVNLYSSIAQDQYLVVDWNNLGLAYYQLENKSMAKSCLQNAYHKNSSNFLICNNYRELSKTVAGVKKVSICKDGWVSKSTGRGTCSHHGGVLRVEARPVYAYNVDCGN